MEESVTIAELSPSLRGPLLLRFEVVYRLPSANNPQEISLKIADQTGCINAYFNKHGQLIKTGEVYELHSFKCRVVQHSLRVEFAKDSKINRVKHDMSFKDLVNNLSDKFYATKAQELSIQQTNTLPVLDPNQSLNIPKEVMVPPASPKQKSPEKESKLPPAEKTEVRQSSSIKKKEDLVKQVRQEKPKQGYKQKSENRESKQKKELKQKNEARTVERQGQKPAKKKYVLKGDEAVKPGALKKPQSSFKSNERVLLKDIYQFRQKDANLIVQVETKTKIVSNKYLLVPACDSSGSAYLEFDSRTHLEGGAWYCLRRFKIFEDKEYKFIASQQSYSTFDVLDEYNEVPDHRPVLFPKSK